MRNIFLVARRELLENMRTKGFWIGILSFPVLLTAGIFLPLLLTKAKAARVYAVVDQSGWLLDEVDRRAFAEDLTWVFHAAAGRAGLSRPEWDGFPAEVVQLAPDLKPLDPDQRALLARHAAGLAAADTATLDPALAKRVQDAAPALRAWWDHLPTKVAQGLDRGLSKARFERAEAGGEAAMNARITERKLFGYFLIGADPVKDSTGCRYVSDNLTDDELRHWFGEFASDAVQERRLAARQMNAADAEWLRSGVRFDTARVSEGGAAAEVRTADRLRQYAPLAFCYILWISVMMGAQMLLTNTVEEKATRIIEVLLSSLTPTELMAGKVFGVASTFFVVLGAWATCFLIGGAFIAPSLGGGIAELGLGAIATDPFFVGGFLFYFVCGYILFASILVGMGSVCNSLKEAQNLLQPVMILLVIPLFLMMPVVQDPNGLVARITSYIPIFTPFVMMNRAGGPPPLIDYILTTILLLLSIRFVMRASGRIFRVGILMTGKPPKFREVLRWMRDPDRPASGQGKG